MSHHEPSSTAVQLLPRPRSSAALDDLIDSSQTTHTAAAVDADNVEELVSSVTASSVSVCIVTFLPLLLLCLQCFDTVGWAAGRASGL